MAEDTTEDTPVEGITPVVDPAVEDPAVEDTADKLVQDEMGILAGGGVPEVTSKKLEIGEDEILAEDTGQLGESTDLPTAVKGSMDGLLTTAPTKPDPSIGQVDSIAKTEDGLAELGDAESASLDRTDPYMDIIQGELSEGALAEAAVEELDEKGTVQYQIAQLMSSLETGGPMPPWAAPQVRKVNALMQRRGLGASSMASAAITQALMESGIQIASKDADKYSAIQLTNLNNKQATALQNAVTIANMDTANLNARLTSAKVNAEAFLSIDLANLNNEQRSTELTYQSQVEGLFNDTAEENARKQFNAKNELQVEEYFAELGAQVDTANANRQASMEQFNASEANSMLQFNATVKETRESFNANMRFAVDQSNAVWRREVNTFNTATDNETNRINVQNEFNANQNALNNLWQAYRDNASWNFTKGENTLAREHDMGLNAMNFANSKDLYSKQQKDDLAKLVGTFLAGIL